MANWGGWSVHLSQFVESSSTKCRVLGPTQTYWITRWGWVVLRICLSHGHPVVIKYTEDWGPCLSLYLLPCGGVEAAFPLRESLWTCRYLEPSLEAIPCFRVVEQERVELTASFLDLGALGVDRPLSLSKLLRIEILPCPWWKPCTVGGTSLSPLSPGVVCRPPAQRGSVTWPVACSLAP